MACLKPSASWPYRDADGALLFEVWRFDPQGKRKEFVPLPFGTMWMTRGGAGRPFPSQGRSLRLARQAP
jgi:hypothetical protein